MNVIDQLICNYLPDHDFYKMNLDETWYWKVNELPTLLDACRFHAWQTVKRILNLEEKTLTDPYVYVDEACRYNNIDNVKYLHSIGLFGSNNAVKYAAQQASPELLQYLYQTNYCIDGTVLQTASLENNISTLEYLYSIGFRLKHTHIANMCIFSELKTIQFLYSKGHYFDFCAVDNASLNNKYDIVEFLVSHNCKFTQFALKTSNPAILDLLNKNIANLDI